MHTVQLAKYQANFDNSKYLPFRHALDKEMLLLKGNRVIFSKKALKKLLIVCDMFLK